MRVVVADFLEFLKPEQLVRFDALAQNFDAFHDSGGVCRFSDDDFPDDRCKLVRVCETSKAILRLFITKLGDDIGPLFLHRVPYLKLCWNRASCDHATRQVRPPDVEFAVLRVEKILLQPQVAQVPCHAIILA